MVNLYTIKTLSESIMSGYRSKRRFAYDVCFRVTTEQREFLEKYAWENKIGIGEAGRAGIDLLMEKDGATS